MIHLERTAGIKINVYAIGQPGKVATITSNTGPSKLTKDEVVRLLRSTADDLERRETWER